MDMGTVVALIKGIAPKADPAVIEQAVSDWLDDHPEATTTVEDGSITEAKLAADVAGILDDLQDDVTDAENAIKQIEETTNEVNPLIDLFGVIGKTKEAYTAENLAHPRKITFIGNPYAFGNCRVANRKNYITKVDAGTSDLNGVTITKRSGVLIYELNGTCTGATEGSTVWDANVLIPKGTYRYFIEIDKGESTIIAGASFKLQFKYDGESSYRNVIKYVEKESESDYLDITFEKDVIALNPRVFVAKNNVYVNYFVWFGLYKNDVNIIDTNETIDDGETYDFVYEYSNIFDVIDTMQHKSAVETIVQTNKALPFVTPEMFGAVGDDSADDTNPLQSCINYAISNGCMVYGKGKYRVTKTIKINGSHLFFRINKLSAWSNTISNYIIEIEGSNNIIEIATISAQYGILLTSHSNTNTKRNYLNIRNMSVSIGHAITLSGTDSYISYNSFHLGQITANAGNCIHTVNFATENWFYGGMMVCPNGWAFYNPSGYKCYNASFERDCYGGIYLEAGRGGMFVGCRSVEMTDKIVAREYGQQDVPPGGTLIKLVGGYIGFMYYAANPIPYEAIDTSEATDVTDPTFDDDPDYDWRPDWRRSSTMANIGRVIARISLGHDNSKGGNATLGYEMIVFNGRKVCKPNRKAVCTIEEADFDMRDIYGSQAHNFPYATKYRINVANCVIHLATSYCCEGYNELIIDQSDPTKLCTIYKSSDSVTPIFDGQTEGAGIYKLSCECDYSLTADMLPSNWTKPTYYYNGYNDVWTVEKLS